VLFQVGFDQFQRRQTITDLYYERRYTAQIFQGVQELAGKCIFYYMLFIQYLLNLIESIGPYLYYNTHHFVDNFELYLYTWKDCPAYICLVKDIAEAYSIEIVFIVFLVSFMTLLSITIKSYVKLKDKFISYLRRRANTTTTAKKSKLSKFINYVRTFKFFK